MSYAQAALEHRNEEWAEAWAERAAVLEYDAGMDREQAEKRAVDMTDHAFRLEGRPCSKAYNRGLTR